jgi:hypothetical protein
MMLDELHTLPENLVARLDPVRVQEYVRAAGWQHRDLPNNGRSALYQRPHSKRDQIIIPLSKELADFAPRMGEAVAYLAQFEKRPALDILADLLLPESDVLRYREVSPAAATGDVPFDHGLALLAGARKTLLAAACSVLRPREPFHPRMSLAEADQFLSQCRLGQTERSSFAITIACPLHAVPAPPDLFALPFTREVTSLLMQSLHRLAHALERADSDGILRAEDDQPVLSANLCEGLLDMAPEGDDASLTIAASYARSLPSVGQEPPSVVRLRRDMFPQIEYLAGRLRPAAISERQFLVGFVETLNGRPNAANRPEGQVIVRVITPDEESLRARVDLDADNYVLADHAHMHNRPFSLEGILRRTGRTYRIEDVRDFDVITLDDSGEGQAQGQTTR